MKHSSSRSPVKLGKEALTEIKFWRAQKEKPNKQQQKNRCWPYPLVIRNIVFTYVRPLLTEGDCKLFTTITKMPRRVQD